MNTTIAITISPPKRTIMQKNIEPYNLLYNMDMYHFVSIMKYNRIRRYILYPEFDIKGRLHYHGTLILDPNQYIRFYKHAIHKLAIKIGFIDVKKLLTFKDKLRWVMYMSKEWGLSKEILSIQDPLLPLHQIKHQPKCYYDDSDEGNLITNYFNFEL